MTVYQSMFLRPFIILPFFYLFGCLTFNSILSAQSNALEQLDQQQPRFMIKHSLSHWLDPYLPGPHLEVEHRHKGTRYWRHQVGYIMDLGLGGQIAVDNLSGFRLRTGYRKYRRAIIPYADTPFWEVSLDYRYIDIFLAGDFWRNNFNFQQRLNYNLWQHSISLNYSYGFSVGISPAWRLDVGLGAGVRLNHREYTDLPSDARFDTNGGLLWGYNSRNGWEFALSVPLVLSVGVALY